MLEKAIPFKIAKYFPCIYYYLFFLQSAFMQAPQHTQSSAAPYPPIIAPMIEIAIPRPPPNQKASEVQLIVQHRAASFICVLRLILMDGAKELAIKKARQLAASSRGPISLYPQSLCSQTYVTAKLNDPQVVTRMRKKIASTIVCFRAFILLIDFSQQLFSDNRYQPVNCQQLQIIRVNFQKSAKSGNCGMIHTECCRIYLCAQIIKDNTKLKERMKKLRQETDNKNLSRAHGHEAAHLRNRDKQAEKTIEQLKQSIGSIEKMIEKSQQILRNTRALQPRQVRSDSLELKLNFNQSKGRTNDHSSKYDSKEQLNQFSTTVETRNNTQASTPIAKQFNSFRQKSSKQVTNFPQRKKPEKPYLFIDTDNLNSSVGDRGSGRDNIFIYDSKSPVSTVTHQREMLQQSFADSLENPFNFGRRLRTEALNDSYQRSFLQSSLERNSIDKSEHGQKKEAAQVKKVVLRRKPKNNNLNLTHLKTYAQLQEIHKSPKRTCIFPEKKSPSKSKLGKNLYSNTKLESSYGQNQLKSKARNYQEKRQQDSTKLPAYAECKKFGKQNSSNEVEQFYKKVKKFGFVQRYLTFAEIGCIHEFLKKSSIPQHKWPLYVVDKVYEKMQGLSRVKV